MQHHAVSKIVPARMIRPIHQNLLDKKEARGVARVPKHGSYYHPERFSFLELPRRDARITVMASNLPPVIEQKAPEIQNVPIPKTFTFLT